MLSKLKKFQLAVLILALFTIAPLTRATDDVTDKIEDSTESPIAAMDMMEPEMKTSTERPSTTEPVPQDEKLNSQRHTVADFIIHPLIAFKPRNPEEDVVPVVGKQASATTSSTTPSPWQLFGFNAGQGLGSSVSSLAGSVTGWINDRIQLPGLVETPVRESTTPSTSTTTTTLRPDVVVRVQHKPTTSRRPLISIDNRNRPNRPDFDSNENDDEYNSEENDDNNDIEYTSNEDGDNEASNENEGAENSEEELDNEVVEKDEEDAEEDTEESSDDDAEENNSQRPNNRRKPARNKTNNRQGNIQQNARRRIPSQRRRPARLRPDDEMNDDSDENISNDDENDEDDDNNSFYYGERPSTKRSQSSSNFIQRGHQKLVNQFRQLTRGQTPAEIGSAVRRTQTKNAANRRRQQVPLFVNRNGQTIYIAPELASSSHPQYQSTYTQAVIHRVPVTSPFPQPPLTTPLKQKGQPVQYITIPWSQLGISPPHNIVAITEGIQSQPFILNIPQSAINIMQSQARPGQANRKKKRPQLITSEAVPLLAEASLMDIFKPPQIPPSRTSGNTKPSMSVTPVFVTAKPTSTRKTPLVKQRIRPGTIVEKADEKKPNNSESALSDQSKIDVHRANGESGYIIVGKDDEPGLSRHVEPVFGDARFVKISANSQLYDMLSRRKFPVHREGRDLTHSQDESEQRIPVQVVSAEMPSITKDQESLPKANETTSTKADDNGSAVSMEKPVTLLAPVENNQTPPETKAT